MRARRPEVRIAPSRLRAFAIVDVSPDFDDGLHQFVQVRLTRPEIDDARAEKESAVDHSVADVGAAALLQAVEDR